MEGLGNEFVIPSVAGAETCDRRPRRVRAAWLAAAALGLLAPAAARASSFACVVDVSMIPDSVLMGPDSKWIAQAVSNAMAGDGVVALDQVAAHRHPVVIPTTNGRGRRLLPDVHVACDMQSQPPVLDDSWSGRPPRALNMSWANADDDDDGQPPEASTTRRVTPPAVSGARTDAIAAAWNGAGGRSAIHPAVVQSLDSDAAAIQGSGRSGAESAVAEAVASFAGDSRIPDTGFLTPNANGTGLGAAGPGLGAGDGAPGGGLTDPTGSIPPTAPAAAAPEPSVWALLIVGLGGVGVALRRSRPRRLARILAV